MESQSNHLRRLAEQYGQGHLFRFWDDLSAEQRVELLDVVRQIDFALMDRLVDTWVRNEPAPEHFEHIEPVDVIPPVGPDTDPAVLEAGEQALREGRVATFVVAGGQGTRLGFDKPKGAYPIGPITGKSLFRYHAEKIRGIQQRYETVLPWYVMVSHANEQQTRDFFREEAWFGLEPENILFVRQAMLPCVDEAGNFLLQKPWQPAMSPNGHGGSIQALMEGGAIADAEARGITVICYFQVDNWAAKVADPWFIGYHCQANAAMSSKCHRRNDPREAVGVHCLCDGAYRVIEYSELDLYPQLLETDENGAPRFFAGNPAIHILSTAFVSHVHKHFDRFPWHKAHKKIPHLDADGAFVTPDKPNGYKFETFVFDALRFVPHPPVALEIPRRGEYTPTKQYDGVNSVVATRNNMAEYWAKWLEAAGCNVPRNASGACTVPIEISPAFALDADEFASKIDGGELDLARGIAIDADGTVTLPASKEAKG